MPSSGRALTDPKPAVEKLKLACTTCAVCAALLRVGAEQRVGAAVHVRRAWLAGIAVVLPAHGAVKACALREMGPRSRLQPELRCVRTPLGCSQSFAPLAQAPGAALCLWLRSAQAGSPTPSSAYAFQAQAETKAHLICYSSQAPFAFSMPTCVILGRFCRSSSSNACSHLSKRGHNRRRGAKMDERLQATMTCLHDKLHRWRTI